MKTAVSQICILLLFFICPVISINAQDYGDEYSATDVAVLRQITSQGGSWNCINWDFSKKPYRLYSIYLQNMRGSLDVTSCSSLHVLECVSQYNNHLASLKVSGCSVLQTLYCEGNQLSSLDVSGCSNLTSLWCSDNQLTSLNISGCSNLTSLVCSNNQLTNINISGFSNLQSLSCGCNLLTHIDVSGSLNLILLECCSNQLTSLNVSGCSNLSTLMCYTNQMASLILHGCLNLQTLQCEGNQLTSLDVSDCLKLKILSCEVNHLTSLDVSQNTILTDLDCSGNNITSLNLKNNITLADFDCSGNKLAFLNLRNGNNHKIKQMHATYNTDLYCIEVDNPDSAATYSNWFKPSIASYSTDCSGKPFCFENNWTVSKTPGMPKHPIGVVADGCSAIKINLTQNDKSITVKRVNITLTDINGFNIPEGQIGTSISQASTPYLNLSYLPDTIFYVAPDMVNYGNYYNYDWNRKVVVQIIINDFSDNGYALCDTIDIIRPPVLLVHGLNSDYKCFSHLQTKLLNSGCYKSGQTYCVDYFPTNQAAFEENSHVLPNSVKGLKRDWKEKGYAVSKLDIVGHSMGGILSRLYLQSSGYDNDIHKLVTLNTPHSGSQGANILVLLPEIRKLIKLEGNAVNDLCVTSFATRTLLNGSSVINKDTVPSYAITTKTSIFSKAVRSNKLGLGMFLAFSALCPSLSVGINSIPSLVYNGESDLVVAVNSQEGGLGSSTLVDNEWHCGSPNNATVESIISKLLMLPSTDAAFSVQGFDPPILESGENFTEIVASLKSFVINNDSVYFRLPSNHITINSGDSVVIEVAKTTNVKNLIFMAMESQDSVYLKDTTAASMSFMYRVPSTSFGSIPMYVFGADTLGHVYMDSVFVTASPSATAQSLAITYPEDSLLELSQGLKTAVRVSCLFSDNITRDITTLPNVQYTTKTGNSVVVSQGVIKGAGKGLDTLLVSYSGLNCSLPISVNQDYTCTIGTSFSPDNTGATTGTGTFFYGDSVTLVATPKSGYTFDYWSENGIEVSTNSNYSFRIYAGRNLVANFKSVTSIETISTDNNDFISIYPNPNDGKFTVDIDADYSGEVEINIFSVIGVHCDHIEFVKSTNKATHEISSKCKGKGIYFVKILLGKNMVTKKIIIN